METVVVRNPYVEHMLCKLRNRSTDRKEFRELLEKAGFIMAYEMAKEFPREEKEIETPVARYRGERIKEEKLGVIAVMRAALPMVNGFLKAFPDARVGFIGASRKEDERAGEKGYRMEVNVGYERIPETEYKILLDPMLATGSTLAEIAGRMKGGRVYAGVLIATEIGIKRVEESGIEKLYVFAVDPELNSRAYIVPGLGDAGDRAFG